MGQLLFIFGEAERGELCTPLFFNKLPHLAETLGNPPEESEGILHAVQTLLYHNELIFFRVREEGFALSDYREGFDFLKKKEAFTIPLAAICIPGVGSQELVDSCMPLCGLHKATLIMNQRDLYDYLTYKE